MHTLKTEEGNFLNMFLNNLSQTSKCSSIKFQVTFTKKKKNKTIFISLVRYFDLKNFT